MEISFHFYQVLSAGLSAFIVRKTVKLELKINLTAAIRFVEDIF